MNRYRHEYKYLINAQQEAILLIKASGIMSKDSHVNADGGYLIRSLYFDDDQDRCMLENENGTDPRSKFRIRYYNNDTTTIHLEKKSKRRGMTLKESCSITEDECRRIIEGENIQIANDYSEMKKKLLLEVLLRRLKPKVIVTYERIPFVYSGGNVRITFDQKLSSSNDIQNFLASSYRNRPVFLLGQSIMEVKWDEVLPLHIRQVLQMDTLSWTAFSKYYMCRTIHL